MRFPASLTAVLFLAAFSEELSFETGAQPRIEARRVTADELEALQGQTLTGAQGGFRLQAAPPSGEMAAELASELLVWLREGVDARGFALARGLALKGTLKGDPQMFVCRFSSVEDAAVARRWLMGDHAVRRVYFNALTRFERMAFVPDDPYFVPDNPPGFPGQWHLKNQFNQGPVTRVEGAWARNLTGAGVMLGIVDDGVERAHPDLAPNYDFAHSYDFILDRPGANPVFEGFEVDGDNHGTAVAGVAAARGGNGIGVTGAAPLARLAGQRLSFVSGFTVAANVSAIKYRATGASPAFRIKNHSYGMADPFAHLDTSMAMWDAFADSSAAGVIHVVSAGNERGRTGQDTNKKWSNAPDAIAVAALSSAGVFASYSCFGAPVFISAPASSFRQGELGSLEPPLTGIVTTDRQVGLGYNPGNQGNTFADHDYTGSFGGTSSAAPLVAGILALAAEANPNLDARLAKHLLARTAELIHEDDAPGILSSHSGWQTNAAGFRFNQNYGFGLINADALTRLATEFSGVTPPELSATPLVNVGATLPDSTSLSRQINVDSATPVETVVVFLDVTHPVRGDLEAYLVSPAGTISRLFVRSSERGGGLRWWFSSHEFWGENPRGPWTLTIHDTVAQGTGGAWNSFVLALHHGEPIPAAAPALPTVTSLLPDEGAVGAEITVTGTKLDGASAVRFNGVHAGFTVVSSEEIQALVPAGASTGPVSVTTAAGTGTSSDSFTVTLAPFIAAFTPTNGPVGTDVVLSGANFVGATAVDFNGTAAGFTVDSATRITATVPVGATTGRIRVTHSAGSGLSIGSFAVNDEPSVLSFAPAVGGVGAAVVIRGGNLGTATNVRFGGVDAMFTVDSTTQLTAIVPPGAATGPIEVTTPVGLASSAGIFTVLPPPFVSGFSPASGFGGDAVVINGQHFLGAIGVRFNDAPASSFAIDSDQRITAIVPDEAGSGPISVQSPGGTGSSLVSFTMSPLPDNDRFADARVLSREAGSESGTNRGATLEPGEPDHAGVRGGRSVWYEWTASESSVWLFDTLGSDFDTVLAVYVGSAVSALEPVTFNDDALGGSNSVVVFQALSGTSYRLAVDGFNTDPNQPASAPSGRVRLSWRRLDQPPVVTGFSPERGSEQTTVRIVGTDFLGAQAVYFHGSPAPGFTVVSATEILTTVPAGATTGPITVETPLGAAVSDVPFVIAVTPANDAFSLAQTLTGVAGTIDASNVGASKEPGEPDHANNRGGRSLWYEWTAPKTGVWTFDTAGSAIDTLLAVYLGEHLGSLTRIVANDNFDLAGGASRVTFTAQANLTYRIAVDGYGGLSGNVRLNYQESPNAPGIGSVSPLSGPPGTVVSITGANLGSTTAVRFNLTLANELTVNSPTSITAVVPLGATTGPVTATTPHGVAGSAEDFVVTGGVDNDEFEEARQVVGLAWLEVGDSALATQEAGEPDHVATGGRSVWFRWQAPSDGVWVISTHGSRYDTAVAVYTGSQVSALSLVAANDDADDSRASRVQFEAAGGITYHVALDGYGGAAGPYVIRMFEVPPVTTIFATGFEPSEGYVAGMPVAGQGGWVKAGSGGEGVVSDFIPGRGQQAFIGFDPPAMDSAATFVGRPLDFVPVDGLTRVRWSTLLAIVDSNNFRYDDFRWTFYNSDFENLLVIAFDNLHLGVYYDNFDGLGFRNTGVRFVNDRLYLLEVLMDFQRNHWSAVLNNVPLADDVLVVGDKRLDLRGIDSTWILGTAGLPGNNYMLFDDYRVMAEPAGEPTILLHPTHTTVRRGGQALFKVVAGGDEPLLYEWRRDGIELPGATNSVLRLVNVTASQGGEYSVLVSNPSGSSVSSPATLAVTELTRPRIQEARVTAGGGFELTVLGNPGSQISIRASTNLLDWFEVGAGFQTGSFRFTDPIGEPTQRFYQVRESDP